MILQAYAQGVNEGLAALGAAPIEYFVLGTSPEPWQVEDTILTGLAMFNTLQGRQGLFEATFGTLADTLARDADFLTARGSEWDAPMTGGRFQAANPDRRRVRSSPRRAGLKDTETQGLRIKRPIEHQVS